MACETLRAHSGGWSPNWVHSAPLPFTVLLCLPRVIVRMENYSAEWRLAGKTELCPPQIPLDQTRARTRAAAVGSQRLTAWAMARPLWNMICKKIWWKVVVTLSRYYRGICLEWLRKTTTIACVPSGIQTQHPSYSATNLFGPWILFRRWNQYLMLNQIC
jgi:hypothetical protein